MPFGVIVLQSSPIRSKHCFGNMLIETSKAWCAVGLALNRCCSSLDQPVLKFVIFSVLSRNSLTGTFLLSRRFFKHQGSWGIHLYFSSLFTYLLYFSNASNPGTFFQTGNSSHPERGCFLWKQRIFAPIIKKFSELAQNRPLLIRGAPDTSLLVLSRWY